MPQINFTFAKDEIGFSCWGKAHLDGKTIRSWEADGFISLNVFGDCKLHGCSQVSIVRETWGSGDRFWQPVPEAGGCWMQEEQCGEKSSVRQPRDVGHRPVLLYGSEAACLSPNKGGDTAHLRSFAAGGQIQRLPTLFLQGALGDQQQGCVAGTAAENPKRCLQEHTQQLTDSQPGSPSAVALWLLSCLGTRAMPSTFLKLKSCSASGVMRHGKQFLSTIQFPCSAGTFKRASSLFIYH